MNIKLIVRNTLMRFYKEGLVKIARNRFANNDFKTKHGKCVPLSTIEKNNIKFFWREYKNIRKHLKWYEFYKGFCKDDDSLKYYIPDDIWYSNIDTLFSDSRRANELDDKNLYDLYFYDVNKPITILRKTHGLLLDEKYNIISLDNAVIRCVERGRIICKEARLSEGGKGIKFFDFSLSSPNDFREYLYNHDEITIQEIVQQHKVLNQIHANSINTIRIMSLVFEEEVHILSSVLRMGRDGAKVDNASSGGIVCGIKQDGRLRDYACDTKGNSWSEHPQGAKFKDIMIVGYKECCELVNKLAGRMCGVSSLVSWDFAIDEKGSPILIEANLTFGEVDFHQMCNGPILGTLTEPVLNTVFNKSHDVRNKNAVLYP